MRSCNNKKNRNPYADFLFTGIIIKHTLFPIVANTYFFVTYWHLSSYFTITIISNQLEISRAFEENNLLLIVR